MYISGTNVNNQVKKHIPHQPSQSLVTLKKSQEKGEAIAKEYGVTFLEVSAKTDKNVERAFSMLAEAILDNSIDIPDAAGVKLRDKEEKTVPKISNKCCQ